MQRHVIVVGAGAAGILAAWRAATLGAKVTLVEKTNRVGTKILVSGGGKCNITHSGPIEDLLKAFRPEEGRFIRPACYRFRNEEIVAMLTAKGLRVYTRPDGRIFPVDQTAKDVVGILRGYLEEERVEIKLESAASGLIVENGAVTGIRYRRAHTLTRSRLEEPEGYRANTAKNLLKQLDPVAATSAGEEIELRADRVILSTGGSSYPNSGTTGDGWPWMRELGHTVTKLRAALAPIYLETTREWSGIALRDIVLKARQGKEIARWQGDLLFTHQGVSGPTALAVSRVVAEQMETGEVTLEVDLRPNHAFEEVAAELLEFASKNPGKRITTFVDALIPDRLVEFLVDAAGIPIDLTGARLDRKARNRLATVLKAWPLGKVRHVPLEKGEVVAGGVSLDEIDPHSMASKRVKGLYLCGEILDVAGPVGGYNLQAAFATGYVAGESAARPNAT
ncbi:NAD(P)/FAD-dependent oxidoreductase [Fimbriimonas ginsengisoli]|uniref:HI0933 family protein n=1 Tax=Fimbriimonas ginsengisoli Gsoil 348 TaxID=661478 RepID=A0A068NWI2_FIMGI|nr:aminoacetone oxidase family FAD-binding enzyme [Fimbriimonas ginsengisoli]AIE87811.1 HI0933 family protein [Fimbriimonas ginsengisoli Gsoil 348]